MAIYINPYLGSESRVFDLLLKISGCDAGLSSVPDVDSLDIRFTPKGAPSFSSNRLREIVGSPKDVWIHGVDDSFMTVWGMPMIEYAGVTDVDITASTQECSIWIDITEAGGLGYRSLDANGDYIYAPPAVILFHELAHVYHSLIVEDTPGTAAPDQLLAIADENQFRAQLGLPARNPNVTMHTIYGPSTVGPTVLKGCNEALFPDLCKCNIATAALGTPIARQIVEFRRAKRDLETLTFCAAPRDLMLRFGVQPAVHLLRIVRTYLGTSPVDATLVAEIERIIGDYLGAT